jgi:hypothetical protein
MRVLERWNDDDGVRPSLVDAAYNAEVDCVDFMAFADSAPRCPDCGSYHVRGVFSEPSKRTGKVRELERYCGGCGAEVETD